MSAGLDILPPGCVCGHDHTTHRGERVEMCLKCSCTEHNPQCQNCGGESQITMIRTDGLAACSARCALQLQYALGLRTAAA